MILTSRTDDTEIRCNGDGYRIEKLTLTGVDKETIEAYLADRDFSAEVIGHVKENENLLDCLRIPLFLTMYGSLHETEGISTRGEILRQFFSERRPDSVYSQRNRAEEMTIKSGKDKALRRIGVTEQCFILDCVLPRIAWEMEHKESFYIDANTIEKIIKPLITGKYYKQICKAYSEKLYSQFASSESKNARSFRDARKILHKFGSNSKSITATLVDCFVLTIGTMQETDRKYSFIHHHIRDYFAAIEDIETIRFSVFLKEYGKDKLAFKCMSPFIENAYKREKSIFIGEYLGEHHNKPYLNGILWQYNVPTSPGDRNLIKRALDIFRGRFGEEVGYGVYNLFEILKDVRGDLSKADLSRLDLTPVTLNGTDLGKSGIPAIVTGAKAGHNNLFPVGHSEHVTSSAYSFDGTRLVTASWDSTAKVWDAKTGALLLTLQGHRDKVNSAAYSPVGTGIVTASEDETAKVWDVSTDECLDTLLGRVTSNAYSPDGTRIVTLSRDSTAKVWDAATGALLLTLQGHSSSFTSAAYCLDGTRIVTASIDGPLMTLKPEDAALFYELFMPLLNYVHF